MALQEWWGITDEIKAQALEFAKQGGYAAELIHTFEQHSSPVY